MNAIKQFDKKNLSHLENEIISAVSALCQQAGVTIKFRGGRYNPNVANLKLEFCIPGQNGENADQLYYKQNCLLYEMKATDLGRRFTMPAFAGTYKLDGMRKGRSKFVFFVIRERDNKRVLITEPSMKTAQWLS